MPPDASTTHPTANDRASAESARDAALAHEREARAFDAPRLAAGHWFTAQQSLNQATESFHQARFTLATNHWTEAARELSAAVETARPARLNELRTFVLTTADLLRATADHPTPADHHRAAQLATDAHLTPDAARPLAAHARTLLTDPTADPLPDPLLATALAAKGSGLGLTTLQYATVQKGAHRLWPLITFFTFLALVAAAVVTLVVLAVQQSTSADALTPLIAAVALSAATGGILLFPVRVATRRPVARGPWRLSLLTSGLLAALLAGGLLATGAELAEDLSRQFPAASSDPDGRLAAALPWFLFGLVALAWPAWSILFWRVTRNWNEILSTQFVLSKLLRGSILELLVAVPAHLWVRRRDECSVGMGTALGIVTGVTVAIFATGPALLLLYAERAARIQPPPPPAPPQDRRLLTPAWTAAAIIAAAGAPVIFITSLTGTLSAITAIAFVVLTIAITLATKHLTRRRHRPSPADISQCP